jgi:hypothetical protein
MATKEIGHGSKELHYPPTAGNPTDDARTDEIRPGTAESARHPDDWGWLFDILPFPTVLPDPIRQDYTIPGSPELDPSDSLTVALPFPAAAIARP